MPENEFIIDGYELNGLGKPEKNPRQIELNQKENDGSISEEEKGELYGLRAFPDNLRGQELRKKEHLGLLSDEENEELRRLYQLKIRRETMTPELQQLWERTEARETNIKQVSMDQGNMVEVLPDDEQEKIIWTFGLGGCIATLLFSEDNDGHKYAILTHFSPLNIITNINELRRMIASNPGIKKSEFRQILILCEEEYEQNPKTKKWESKIDQKADILTSAIQAELGQNVEVKIEPYSSTQGMGKDHGSLIVKVPPKGQATYRTWFSQGYLGVRRELNQQGKDPGV